jgi:hypothetical protein
MDTILSTTFTSRMSASTFIKRRRFRPGRAYSGACHPRPAVLSTKQDNVRELLDTKIHLPKGNYSETWNVLRMNI